MALEYAILVSLAEQSATGYDLARRFDASIGNFWHASHQQIYRVLARMESDDWVDVTVVTQAGKPDKKIYEVNRVGLKALSDWLITPTSPEALRSEFAVKLRALHLTDRESMITAVKERREQHASKLARYEASRRKYFSDESQVPDHQVGIYLVLRGGIRTERAGIDWCSEILDYLEAR